MKKFLATQFFKFNSMKIVHSIPGRIRFSVPGLKMIDSEFLHFEEELVRILSELKGVKEFTLSVVTGKALASYDSSIIDERTLLVKFELTWDRLINEILALDSDTPVTEELVQSFIPRLETIIDEVNENG